jgi:hypothetical protein
LSISHDIVTQQHGGSITVESVVGEFSEFSRPAASRRAGTRSRRRSAGRARRDRRSRDETRGGHSQPAIGLETNPDWSNQ